MLGLGSAVVISGRFDLPRFGAVLGCWEGFVRYVLCIWVRLFLALRCGEDRLRVRVGGKFVYGVLLAFWFLVMDVFAWW
jgi:hypothetical protein